MESIAALWNYISLQNLPLVFFATAHRDQLMFSQAESLRLSLHKLEELLDDYSPLMSESTQGVLEKAIKYGAAFAEVSSRYKETNKDLTPFS